MTKAQYQVKFEELESTIHCLTLEKTKLENEVKLQKPQIESYYREIHALTQDVIQLNRTNRILLKGQ